MTKRPALLLAMTAALALSGCANQTIRDLEGVPVQDPDATRIYTNVDQYPNLVVNCIDGVAFVTTTREYGDAVTRVPELDETCPR